MLAGFKSKIYNRLPEFYSVVKKSRASVISVLFVVLAFIFVPQTQDVLRSMAQPDIRFQLLFFEVLSIAWAIIVWFGARFMLDQDFEVMRGEKQVMANTVPGTLLGEHFVPRFLAAAGLIGIGVAMVISVHSVHKTRHMRYDLIRLLGICNIAAGVVLYYALRFRRKVMQVISDKVVQRLPMGSFRRAFTYTPGKIRKSSFSEFPSWLRIAIVSGLGVVGSFWIFIVITLQAAAPAFGAANVVIIAFTVLSVCATVLVWIGERLNIPLIMILIIAAGIFGIYNDNHAVRYLDKKAEGFQQITPVKLCEEWLARMDREYGTKKPHPMFIVAASGGGIKAAYWTATVLGNLQDKNDAFAKHTIAISPVSGGALGSLVFVNLLANDKAPGDRYAVLGQWILKRDFLSPALGSLFFLDLPARFWPFPNNPFPDRASALEQAWEKAWAAGSYKNDRHLPASFALWKGKNIFQKGLSTLYDDRKNKSVPALLINGTSVDTGQRIITAFLNISGGFKDCKNNYVISPNDIRMSTAAMMSARFTYVSPAGTLDGENHVVDGGYYENSGAVTALQFYESIEEFIAKVNRKKTRIIPIFIQIDNDYADTADTARKKEHADEIKAWKIFPELRAPVVALLKTRNAHAVTAAEKTKQTFSKAGGYYRYTFDTPGDVKAPLGWFLSKAAQEELKDQLLTERNLTITRQITEILREFNVKADVNE